MQNHDTLYALSCTQEKTHLKRDLEETWSRSKLDMRLPFQGARYKLIYTLLAKCDWGCCSRLSEVPPRFCLVKIKNGPHILRLSDWTISFRSNYVDKWTFLKHIFIFCFKRLWLHLSHADFYICILLITVINVARYTRTVEVIKHTGTKSLILLELCFPTCGELGSVNQLLIKFKAAESEFFWLNLTLTNVSFLRRA